MRPGNIKSIFDSEQKESSFFRGLIAPYAARYSFSFCLKLLPFAMPDGSDQFSKRTTKYRTQNGIARLSIEREKFSFENEEEK